MPVGSPSRRARLAAPSAAPIAGSVKRTTSDRVSAPWCSTMSRSTPPAETEASCLSSPMRRTLAPVAMAWAMTASRPAVEAIPASSTTIKVVGADVVEPGRAGSSGAGAGPFVVPVSWTSLSMVSVGAPRSAARISAAAAVGARPMTVPPLLAHAAAKGCHGGGLAGASRGERELDAGAGGGHVAQLVRAARH